MKIRTIFTECFLIIIVATLGSLAITAWFLISTSTTDAVVVRLEVKTKSQIL